MINYEYKRKRLYLDDLHFPLKVEENSHKIPVVPHYHEFFELVYVDKGIAIHKSSQTTDIFVAGDLFIIPPNVEHEYLKTINNRVYNCAFLPNVLEPFLSELQKMPLLCRILKPDPSRGWNRIRIPILARFDIADHLRKLEYETSDHPPGYELRAQALFASLLILLSRLSLNSFQYNPSFSLDPDTNLLGALQYFDDNPEYVADIPHRYGYSTDGFARLFKKYTGLTPSAYSVTSRIARASEYLLNLDNSISEAAEQAGFDDFNYFSRLFKKETGLTPSQFRQQFE